jgi:hypothetical protein
MSTRIGIGIGIEFDLGQQTSSVSPPTVSSVSIPTSGVVGTELTGTYTLGGGPADTVTRRWYRGATEIFSSTTVDTYTPVQDDAGNNSDITLEVTATNAGGSDSDTSNVLTVVYDAMAWDYRERVIAEGDTMTLARLQLFQEMVIIPQKTTLEKANFGAGVNKGAIHIITAENATQARLNILNANFKITTINSPTFAADAYYTGGTGMALNSNWNPSTLSLGTNNIMVAALFNNVPSSGFHFIGAQSSTAANSTYIYTDATSMNGRMLTTNERGVAFTAPRIGWNSIGRNSDSMIFNDPNQQGTVVDNVDGVFANLSLYDLAVNINGSVNSGSNRQQCASLKGAYLTDTELNDLRTAIIDYCKTINPSLNF